MKDQSRTAGLDLIAAGEAQLDEVVALRRAIHADPELGLQSPRTPEKINAALAGLPLEFREGPSTTGLVATLRGGDRRTVLLRGDVDALPMTEERPDAAFALRLSPNLHHGFFSGPSGALLASTDVLHAVVRGRGGYAA